MSPGRRPQVTLARAQTPTEGIVHSPRHLNTKYPPHMLRLPWRALSFPPGCPTTRQPEITPHRASGPSLIWTQTRIYDRESDGHLSRPRET